jgi:hypothetical protein
MRDRIGMSKHIGPILMDAVGGKLPVRQKLFPEHRGGGGEHVAPGSHACEVSRL